MGYSQAGRRMSFEPWRSEYSIVLCESLSFLVSFLHADRSDPIGLCSEVFV